MNNSVLKGDVKIKILGRKNDSNTWRSTQSSKYLVDYSFLVSGRLADGKNYQQDGFYVQECAYYSRTLGHHDYHSSNLSKWIYRLRSDGGYGSVLSCFLSKYVVFELPIHQGFRGDFEKETCDPRNNGADYLAGRSQMGLADKKTMAQIEGKQT